MTPGPGPPPPAHLLYSLMSSSRDGPSCSLPTAKGTVGGLAAGKSELDWYYVNLAGRRVNVTSKETGFD